MKIDCKKIKLIVYDFDGVMTDNRVLVGEDGKESVLVHRGDGFGVRMIKDELKIPQIILSTEVNSVVAKRAAKLSIPVIHGVHDKPTTLTGYCGEQGIALEHVLFIGNDLNDIDVMMLCGIRMCPSDAEPEIIEVAHHVFSVKGGYGVIRELYRNLQQGNG